MSLWKRRPLGITMSLVLAMCLFAGACEPPPEEPVAPPPDAVAPEEPPPDKIRPSEPMPAVRPPAEPEEEEDENAGQESNGNGNSDEEAAGANPSEAEHDAEAVLPAAPSPETEAIERLALLSESFREVTRAASPSVVQVSVEARPRIRRRPEPRISPEDLEELFRRFGPLLPRDPELRQFFRDREPRQEQPDFDQYNIPLPIGNASGWIYDDQGHIITSHHVVARAETITVTFLDETEVEARVVGSDPPTDVAVLKVAWEDLPPATMATRPVEQGDIVLAIGAPFRYAFSVSQGIVSATERQVGILGPHGYENFIQTDAAMNPGNSGGPLVNAQGEVVGMSTAIAGRAGQFAGLGFATPVDMIREVADALIREGVVSRGYLGAMISDDRQLVATFGVERGVLIEDLVEGGPGDQAGLQPGDVVVGIDDEQVLTTAALRRTIARTQPGTTVTLTLLRDREWGRLEVTLGQQPIEDLAPDPVDEPPPPDPDEAEPLAKLGFQRLLTVTPELAEEHGLEPPRGVLVLEVRPFSAAAMAGLRQGNIIIEVHGQEVTSVGQVRKLVEEADLVEGVRMRVQIPGGPARFVLLSLER